MELKRAIGIDPDSKGFYCVFQQEGIEKRSKKYFFIDNSGLQEFMKWVLGLGDVIIAIEGSNGQSRPIEKILRSNKIVFYSIKPSSVTKYRKAVMGENKNNDKDAEAVGGLALALARQNKLENFRRVWFPNDGIQLLSRFREKEVKHKTALINSLWKMLRIASPDIYLMLTGGKKTTKKAQKSRLENKNLLNLLANKPNIAEWKNLAEYELLEAMGGKCYRGVMEMIEKIKSIAEDIESAEDFPYLLIGKMATEILVLKKNIEDIEKELKKKALHNKEIQSFMIDKGIGLVTAAKLKSEIVDIRRFAKNDNLASYCGLGRKTDDTGDKKSEKKDFSYNRRLKDAFITAAKNFVRFNPDHHLSGYCKNMIKGGMKIMEAYKRVARALVRIYFKRLYGLLDIRDPVNYIKNKGGMANGKTRDNNLSSNIPPDNKLSLTCRKEDVK
jgi:hypothetical protein